MSDPSAPTSVQQEKSVQALQQDLFSMVLALQSSEDEHEKTKKENDDLKKQIDFLWKLVFE